MGGGRISSVNKFDKYASKVEVLKVKYNKRTCGLEPNRSSVARFLPTCWAGPLDPFPVGKTQILFRQSLCGDESRGNQIPTANSHCSTDEQATVIPP